MAQATEITGGGGFGEAMRNFFRFTKTTKRKPESSTIIQEIPEPEPVPIPISVSVPELLPKEEKQTFQPPMRSLPASNRSTDSIKKKRATVLVKDDKLNGRSNTLPSRTRTVRHPVTMENRRSSQYWGPPPMQRSTGGRYTDNHRMSRIMMGLEFEDDNPVQIEQTKTNDPMPVSILLNDQAVSNSNSQRIFSEPIPASKRQNSISISPTPSIEKASPQKSTNLQRSYSVSSTSRARPRGSLPSAMEMQRRSSQFMGYWCPYPSTVEESSPVLERNEEEAHEEILDISCDVEDQEEVPLTSDQAMMPYQLDSQSIDKDKKEDQMQDLMDGQAGSESNPSSNSHESPIPISKSLPNSLIYQKENISPCWAVARGWKIGIYFSREEAQKQIENFPGPLMQQFTNDSEAKQWLKSGVTNSRRIPSVRTLELDEDFDDPSLSRMSLYERADMIENRVKSAYNVRK